jgi:hypothetical protein
LRSVWKTMNSSPARYAAAAGCPEALRSMTDQQIRDMSPEDYRKLVYGR